MGYQGHVVGSNPAFIQASTSVGIPIVKDLNSGDGVGAKQGTAAVTTKYQRSSAYCFYDHSKGRSNLKVLHETPVQRLIFSRPDDTAKPRASGVVFMSNPAGVFRHVSAKHEVILTLGALQSPQLLMVSVCLIVLSRSYYGSER